MSRGGESWKSSAGHRRRQTDKCGSNMTRLTVEGGRLRRKRGGGRRRKRGGNGRRGKDGRRTSRGRRRKSGGGRKIEIAMRMKTIGGKMKRQHKITGLRR